MTFIQGYEIWECFLGLLFALMMVLLCILLFLPEDWETFFAKITQLLEDKVRERSKRDHH